MGDVFERCEVGGSVVGSDAAFIVPARTPKRRRREDEGSEAGEPRAPSGQRDTAQSICLFRDGGARPPIEAMTCFTYEHRSAFGVEPNLQGAADCPVNLLRECRQAPGRGPRVGPRPKRRHLEDRDTPCLRGEPPCLWRAEGLAAIKA